MLGLSAAMRVLYRKRDNSVKIFLDEVEIGLRIAISSDDIPRGPKYPPQMLAKEAAIAGQKAARRTGLSFAPQPVWDGLNTSITAFVNR